MIDISHNQFTYSLKWWFNVYIWSNIQFISILTHILLPF